jgi:cytoskeleton protein RodZ
MGDIGRIKTNWKRQAPAHGDVAVRPPESVAMHLRNERILQGYSLSEVASALNIREGHLLALEEGNFSSLPPLVYAQGFVSAYAGFLHLDRSDLVARFRQEAHEAATRQPTAPQFNLSPAAETLERRLPSLPVVLVGLILVALAYGFWQSSVPDQREAALSVPPLPDRFSAQSPETASAPQAIIIANPPQAAVSAPYPAISVEQRPPAPISAQPMPQAQTIPQAQPMPQQAAPSVYQGAGMISLRAFGESWVQLRNAQGQRVASFVLRAGQTYIVPRTMGRLDMVTGSLSNLAIILDGRSVSLRATPNRNRYIVSLDPARLLDGSAVLE